MSYPYSLWSNPTGTRAVATGSEHSFQASGLASTPWGIFTVSPESGGALAPPPVFYYWESHSESWGELLILLAWADKTHPLLFVPSGYPQIQSYDVQVADTDYNQFAMVYFQKTSENKQYFKVTLYGEFLPDPSGLNFRSHPGLGIPSLSFGPFKEWPLCRPPQITSLRVRLLVQSYLWSVLRPLSGNLGCRKNQGAVR